MSAFDVVRFNVAMFGMDEVEAAEEVAIDSFTEMFEDAQCEAIALNAYYDRADAYEAAAEAYDDECANPW